MIEKNLADWTYWPKFRESLAESYDREKKEEMEKVKNNPRIMAIQIWRKTVLQAIGRGKAKKKSKGYKSCNEFF